MTRDVKYRTPEGLTALTMAREAGYTPYVDLLLECGARDN